MIQCMQCLGSAFYSPNVISMISPNKLFMFCILCLGNASFLKFYHRCQMLSIQVLTEISLEATTLGRCICHRYLKKRKLVQFVTCRLLALPVPRAFLKRPPTVLTRETRQAIHAINQSISLQMSMAFTCSILVADFALSQCILWN